MSEKVIADLAEGIVRGIAGAVGRLAPARLSYAEHTLADDQELVHRRAQTAGDRYLRAIGQERLPHVVRVLRVDAPDGAPRGLVSFLGLHGTCVHGTARRLHPDHKGLTARRLEEAVGDGFVAVCAQEAAGDLTPNHVPDPDRGVTRGHQADDYDHVAWVAARQAEAVEVAWRAASDEGARLEGPLDAALHFADFAARTFEHDGRTLTTTPPTLGLGMALGTLEGPGPLGPYRAAYEGLVAARRRLGAGDPKVPLQGLADGPDGRLFGLLPTRALAALAKVRPAWTGFWGEVVGPDAPQEPWAPTALPVQVLRIGGLRIAALSAEPTSGAGHWLRERLVGGATEHLVVLGYSNGYGGYVTTPEAYEAQDYEGACTLYGPHTLALWGHELGRLQRALDGVEGLRRTLRPERRRAEIPTSRPFRPFPRPRGAHGLPRRAEGPVTDGAHFDTVVVGAGFAGLHAARTLQRAGQRVLVLEATSRVGGRARSTPDGAELGCGFVGGRHRLTLALLRELGLELVDFCAHAPPDPAFRSITPEGVEQMTLTETWFGIQGCKKDARLSSRLDLLGLMTQWMALERLVHQREPWRTPFAGLLDRLTVQDWMDAVDLRPKHRDLIRLAVTGLWSTEPHRMSLLYLLWYTATNGGLLEVCNDQVGGPQQFGVRGGLGGAAEALARAYDGHLLLDTPVTRIERGEVVRVHAADGRSWTARDVIVAATPAAVHRHVTFEPPLPEPTRAFLDQPTGHAVKAVVEYGERWWRDNADGLQFQFFSGGAGRVFEWMLEVSEPDRGVYRFAVFLRSPRPGATADELREAFCDELFQVTGDPRCREVTRFACFDWREAPYVGGGLVSICGPGVLSRQRSLEEVAGVHFAGAEYGAQYTGYVEGALRSAARAAERVLHGRVVTPSLVAPATPWAGFGVAAAAAVQVQALARLAAAVEDRLGVTEPPTAAPLPPLRPALRALAEAS